MIEKGNDYCRGETVKGAIHVKWNPNIKQKILNTWTKCDSNQGHIPCLTWNTLTPLHVPEVTTVLHQAHMDAALHVFNSASQYHAVNLPGFICNVLFQCVSCAWFVAEYPFFKVAPPNEIWRGQT